MRDGRGGFNRGARVEEPAFGALDGERRQGAAAIGAGVDADAVRPLVDRRADGVAVDDDESVVGLVDEKRLADPAQVRLALAVERDARVGFRRGRRGSRRTGKYRRSL